MGKDVPLVSVLRDTLGDNDPANDKVTAVWLLRYSRPSISQHAVAAVPFFYWHLNEGSSHVSSRDTAPLLDLDAPERPAVTGVERLLLQWTTLDTFDTTVRASSRAYNTNQVDEERLRLEEANSYLLHAPTGGPGELTTEERDAVMARLELRKSLLGGFVDSSRVSGLGQRAIYEREEIRSRNWELLRECAEKTGLIFQPLTIGEAKNDYGMLWFPAGASNEPDGSDEKAIWKLLNIKDPYSDDSLTHWDGITQTRGSLKLIPLGLYNLNYRREPLLMVDFRDKKRLRRHELLQQTVNELTSGVIGLSHFANWYYFVGADMYNFYQGRRGKATVRTERLDCYSQFRVALALDRQLDPALRAEMQSRVNSLSINPLQAAPDQETKAAINRYTWLAVQASGDDRRLLVRVDNQRRAELAEFGQTQKRQGMNIALRAITLGRYTHRAKPSDQNLATLDIYRRVNYYLAFLDRLVKANTAPEVSYDQSKIRAAIAGLNELMPEVNVATERSHVQNTLDKLASLSNDGVLRADCAQALTAMRNEQDAAHPLNIPGVVAWPLFKEDL